MMLARDASGILGKGGNASATGILPSLERGGRVSSGVQRFAGSAKGYAAVTKTITLDGSGSGSGSVTFPSTAKDGLAFMALAFGSASGADFGYVALGDNSPIGVPLVSGSGLLPAAWLSGPSAFVGIVVSAPGATGGSFNLTFTYPTR